MAEEKHFYGGQAIMEGVMMRGTDSWGAAVQRKDGTVVTTYEEINDITHRYKWAKWPLIRGNVALVDTLFLGIRSLMFSFNVLVEEQQELERTQAEAAAAAEAAAPASVLSEDGKRTKKKKSPKKQSDMGWAVWLAMLPSMAIGVGLFVLLPAALIKWLPAIHQDSHILKNLFEGIVRLTIILGYISLVSLMPDIRRLFQYHGGEHATINCYEDGQPVTLQNCLRYSPLHPRCGTAFLLVFIVVKIIVGALLPYPEGMLQLLALRLGMIPVVAAIAYEIIRYGGRHRDSLLSRVLAQPGLLMQRLSTRQPGEQQVKIAIYALASVAGDDVPLPADFAPSVAARMDGKIIKAQEPVVAVTQSEAADEEALS
ncbi:MAG: DUF1385 domain-containing protein [Armatimonadota bacterium]